MRGTSDELMWDKVYSAVIESTWPPRPMVSSNKPSWLHNTSGFANSSEHRKYVDVVLEEELGLLYVGIRRFHEIFGGVADLETTSESDFKRCVGATIHSLCEEWKTDGPKTRTRKMS
jgi:hypothetical protein